MAFTGAAKGYTVYAFASLVLTATLASTAVRARDDYPSRPVQMIIPFAAGGPTDIVGRVMGAKMGELLSQQFIV
jgi:tripartite-type tricarboxylate transporter receptor subunit TctC